MTAVAATTPADTVTDLVADQAGNWDLAGAIPVDVLRRLGAAGVLCGQVPGEFGGLGLSALDDGQLTAHTGGLCSSVRSVQTSQGMAAWTLRRWGTPTQQRRHLPGLVGGDLAAVAFSEPDAGSDLAAMRTAVRPDGDVVRVDGHKVWVTGAAYADLIVLFGRYGDGVAAVLVPTDTPGVTVTRVAHPSGCRAAGHADVLLDGVTLPADHVLPGAGAPIGLLTQSALTFGRLSIAWGCLGIIRACLTASARHTTSREQFGVPLARHQLVARHLGEMVAAEQTVLRLCEHAARSWDARAAEHVTAALVAKHVGATQAVATARAAVQLHGNTGAHDGHPVARAHRDAKLMEIIEGSSEICQLQLAEHATGEWA